MDLETIKEFESPSNYWRGKPFWSWNGKLEKEELLRQVDVMEEMGFGGFFMHSRTGLETEYLGDEWFELINACADYAEEKGLEAWLYDEDRWPSGLAGGIVSKHPEYRQKAIFLDISDVVGEHEGIINQWVAKLEGPKCTELELFEGTIPEGKQLLTFKLIEQGKSGFYNGYTYIDTMNPNATQAFLESTHEKYVEKCGSRLGSSIKGIFTDEPHRGALLDGFSMYMEKGNQAVPYTDSLFEDFINTFGYDLKEKLPELFLQIDGKRISKVKWQYTELLQQLFIKNFAVPCQKWCDDHNLVLTGHILHEDNLTAQTAMSGSMMRYYEHMNSPGVDVLTENNENWWIVKQLTSAARQVGKTQLLSELYGCTGWQMPFSGHKEVGDWQALFGINLRCHHLSWYTMKGEAKRDYPASILHQSAWYPQYKYVEDYFSRIGYMMSLGEPVCDVLVLNPVESVWSQVYLGWSNSLSLKDEHIADLQTQYEEIFTWLIESQVDFDYGDEEMISRLGSSNNGVLQVGKAQYKTVVVAGMDTIRGTTLELLKEFIATGGSVVVAGNAPEYIDAEYYPKEILSDLSEATRVAWNKADLVAAMPKAEAYIDRDGIFSQLRKCKDSLIFASLNMSREARQEDVTVRMKTRHPIYEWDCETGERRCIDTSMDDDHQSFVVDYAVGGNKLFIASSENVSNLENLSIKETDFEKVEVSGPFKYELSEPNVCVLDSAEYRIDSGAWEAETDVLKIDNHIRDSHGAMKRGGHMLQPYFVAKNEVKQICDVDLRFHFEIEKVPDSIELVLEDPEKFSVTVNGHELDLSDRRQWIDCAFFKFRIESTWLKVGKNVIDLSTNYKENSNLEALYLIGDFGVALNGSVRRIITQPDKISVGDICEQGFPFYSAGMTVTMEVPESTKYFKVDAKNIACATVDGAVVAWDPWLVPLEDSKNEIDVQLIFTRRNTFGPLHNPERYIEWVTPASFVTEGEEFSMAPVLFETGFSNPPTFLK